MEMNVKEKARDLIRKNEDILKVGGMFAGLVGIGYLIGHVSAVRHIDGMKIKCVVPDGYDLVKIAENVV